MFCIECGKANPEGAKFCAFCGKKLFTGEPFPAPEAQAGPDLPAPVKADPAPASETPAGEYAPESAGPANAPAPEPVRPPQPEKAAEPAPVKAPEAEKAPAPEPRPYQRARQYRTLQPTMENPAQPDREPRESAQPAPAPQPVQPEPEPEPAEPLFEELVEPEIEDWWNEPKNEKQPPAEPIEPPEDLWAGADESEPEDLWADGDDKAEKKKFTFPWQRGKEDNMVLTADGTEEMPARKPVIARKRRDTRIPERIIKSEEPEEKTVPEDDEEPQDIFFMRPKRRSRQEEDAIDDAYVNSRVRTILFAIAFVACLFTAVWLFATDSGQMFLAGFNLSADAEAYRDLGDSALANNQVKRAAEAYYRALSLDPDDFETALLVGKTQQQIGEYGTAADAYYMCTQLDPTAPEPYEALVRLYISQGEPEKAEYFRDLGAVNAGLDLP